MRSLIFGVEFNGFDSTKIHCMSVSFKDKSYQYITKSTTDYRIMRKLFTSNFTLTGHNIIRSDITRIENILNIKSTCNFIDTLPVSWYIFPNEKKHDVEYWGTVFNISSIQLDESENINARDYKEKCETDVLIIRHLWEIQKQKLKDVYGNADQIKNVLKYLMFKMSCIKDMEDTGWILNIDKCKKQLEKLESEKEIKIQDLKEIMPRVDVVKKINKLSKKGSISPSYKKIIEDQLKIVSQDEKTVSYVCGSTEPNPCSQVQLKKFLFSLGWVPLNYKTGEGKKNKIPQIKKINSNEICESIEILVEKHPSIKHVESLSILTHRVGVLKGFLRNQVNGRIFTKCVGLTNTLRLKHSVVVNLPKNESLYSENIRSCLIAENEMEMCGSDMSSLEDRTKQHFIWNYDKEYVKEMLVDNFDPHLSLAVFCKAITKDQANQHIKKEIDVSNIRNLYKTVNYACVYGASAKTLANISKISHGDAIILAENYWKKNWSVKEVAKRQITKKIKKENWLYNPKSKIWYNLRNKKDTFSTLNQSTATFCFDVWVREIKKQGVKLTSQFHDEIVFNVIKNKRDYYTEILQDAINSANGILRLNVPLGIDIKFGSDYGSIH